MGAGARDGAMAEAAGSGRARVGAGTVNAMRGVPMVSRGRRPGAVTTVTATGIGIARGPVGAVVGQATGTGAGTVVGSAVAGTRVRATAVAPAGMVSGTGVVVAATAAVPVVTGGTTGRTTVVRRGACRSMRTSPVRSWTRA